MSDPNSPETQSTNEVNESFGGLLSEYERDRSRAKQEGGNQIEATVIAVSADTVFLDIGYKTEGTLPVSELQKTGDTVKPGDKLLVTIKGRDPEGYYQLSRFKIARPTDWSSLERAFEEKSTIVGTVTGVVKGGLSVDVGVRAFMPASRSGVRDAAEMEKLVEQEIRCRIIKLDVAEEDVVVDRRIVAEEEERTVRDRRYSELKEGDTVQGEVRSLADYGAFVDIGGVDGLLHVGEISWTRINKPSDLLSVGQRIEARVIKVEPEKRRIALSLKQVQPHPWESISDKYKPGEKIRGTVTRVMEFGAFVELDPGIEGLIHVSEMSWGKKIRIASDVVKPGETVDAVILSVNPAERRIALGLKQALGDPWADAEQRFGAGTVVEAPVTSVTSFGAFVELAKGIEGMIHVSEMSAEKRINHPRDMLRVGQRVQAQVLAIDKEKRQLRLSMKQLVPNSLDEYLGEHKPGDLVTGRIVELSGDNAKVELGEGIHVACRVSSAPKQSEDANANPVADLSALTSMLSARWRSGSVLGSGSKWDEVRAGQVRSFRIVNLDPAAKQIELELA